MEATPTTQRSILDWEFSKPLTIVVLLTIAYGLIFFLTLLGNALVIISVLRDKEMRSVINYLLCNLSVADILVALIVLPFTLLQNIFKGWHYGDVACHVVPYLQGSAVSGSVFTLTIISIDRWLAVCYGFKRYMDLRKTKRLILLLWILSFLILLPWAIFYRVQHSLPYPQCIQDWPQDYMKRVYFLVVVTLLLYTLPLCLISLCYMAVANRVWRRYDHQNQALAGGSAQPNLLSVSGGIDRQQSIRMIKMLITVVCLFALSWFPFYLLFNLLFFFAPDDGKSETWLFVGAYILPLCQLLGASNSCVNPWVYFFYSAKYRNSFTAILLPKCCRRQPRNNLSRQQRVDATAVTLAATTSALNSHSSTNPRARNYAESSA